MCCYKIIRAWWEERKRRRRQKKRRQDAFDALFDQNTDPALLRQMGIELLEGEPRDERPYVLEREPAGWKKDSDAAKRNLEISRQNTRDITDTQRLYFVMGTLILWYLVESPELVKKKLLREERKRKWEQGKRQRLQRAREKRQDELKKKEKAIEAFNNKNNKKGARVRKIAAQSKAHKDRFDEQAVSHQTKGSNTARTERPITRVSKSYSAGDLLRVDDDNNGVVGFPFYR